MILYGWVTGTSILACFMSTAGPGILITINLSLLNLYLVRKYDFPLELDTIEAVQQKRKELVPRTISALPALLMPVIILGGIYGGIMTPTEAAGVAALYGFLVGMFVLKGITRENFIEILVDSSVTAATVLFLVAMASVFGYVMAIEQVPDAISEWMMSITSNKFAMLLIVNILLLIVGALMESASATLILAPILMPMMIKLGVDPVHFGVIMVCNLSIGFITPPVGQSLFVAAAISDERTERIAVAAAPLLASMLVMLLIVTYIPEVSLFLTRFM